MRSRTLSENAEAILTRKHWVFDLDGTLTLPVHDFSIIRQVLGVPQGNDILGYLAPFPMRRRSRSMTSSTPSRWNCWNGSNRRRERFRSLKPYIGADQELALNQEYAR